MDRFPTLGAATAAYIAQVLLSPVAACRATDRAAKDSARSAGRDSSPSAAAAVPAPDSAVLAAEREQWAAVQRRDAAAFSRLVAAGWPYVQGTGITHPTEADVRRDLEQCETKSFAIDSATVTPVGDRGAVATYRLTLDQTCGGRREPSPIYVLSVWEQRGGRWRLVAGSDVPAQPRGK